MGKLVLYLPDGSIHDIPLDKERVTIGRRPENDVCLPYPAVSGEHAAVVNILADSFLEDLGSTNGTLVNGKAVVKHFLRDNDLIDIGRQRLVYFSDAATRAEPLPPDVLRRDVLGLHEQVERVRIERVEERRKPLSAPGASGPGTADPLMPDEELLADLEAASFPGEKVVERPGAPVPPEGRPRESGEPGQSNSRSRESGNPASSRPQRRTDPSAVATRLASTWTETPAEAARPASAPQPAVAAGSSAQPKRTVASYIVRVLSGPNAGRELPLTRDEFSVGRAGSQVARIARLEGQWRLALIEGDPITLNGTTVPADGAALAPGDRFTVAGVELAFDQR